MPYQNNYDSKQDLNNSNSVLSLKYFCWMPAQSVYDSRYLIGLSTRQKKGAYNIPLIEGSEIVADLFYNDFRRNRQNSW
jgi:hypothetical protein